MNKWTYWLTGVGLSTVLVAMAISLAQRDSRNEIDPTSKSPLLAPADAKPITFGDQNSTQSDASKTSSYASLDTNQPGSPLPALPSNFPNTAVEEESPKNLDPSMPASFVALASAQEPVEDEVIRGNDEPAIDDKPGNAPTTTAAANPPPPAMVPFPFTKPNAAPSTAPTTSGPATPPGATPPVAEIAQLPTLPQAIERTGDGLKKVAEQASQTMTDVGRALDPRQAFSENGSSPNTADRQPRPLSTPSPGAIPSLLPNGAPPAMAPNIGGAPPATIGSAPLPTSNLPTAADSNNQGNVNRGLSGNSLPPTSQLPSDNNSSPIASFNTSGNNSSMGPGSRVSSSTSIDSPNIKSFPSSRLNSLANTDLVSADPGERGNEGTQTPTLQLSKRAPEEVRIGRPATFTLMVKNSGNVIARQVQVIDSVPNGTQFVGSQPTTEPDNNGLLVWDLGDIPPGNERVIQIQLTPESEGEIGSVASVTFAAVAGVRTLATEPKLALNHNVSSSVLLGDQFAVQLQITNNGSGIAEKVLLEADLPANVKCAAGSQIVADIGNLAPGKSQTIDLPLQAIEPGQGQIALRVMSEDEMLVEQNIDFAVSAPELKVAIEGPTKRFIERQARFVMKVENVGSAPATNVDLVAQLPKGFRFNGTGQKGQYDPARHAVLWSLEELPAGVTANVELDIVPVDMGSQAIHFQVTADLNAQAKAETTVAVEGLSELSFAIDDDNDPVEVDGETTYTIKVTNNGTRADGQVQLAIDLPAGATLVGQPEGPVQADVNGGQITFAPLPAMKAKDSVQYQFTVRWSEEGLQVLRARITSQNRAVPVTKEEATEVYLDR